MGRLERTPEAAPISSQEIPAARCAIMARSSSRCACRSSAVASSTAPSGRE
ncbi:hypothetical protein [Nonomuraea typhae]|uniref:hypothetical protein n=1 Tax=Nonomuraea typhae TaxID=2603600 RepID=UPI0012FA81DB|nr:hypothetical protein [Nonomuraea typhae]